MHRHPSDDHRSSSTPSDERADGIKSTYFDGLRGGWDASVTSVRVGEVWNRVWGFQKRARLSIYRLACIGRGYKRGRKVPFYENVNFPIHHVLTARLE